MHGRLKVRTSEEEKVRKEKERLAKLKLFRIVTAKIQTKRINGALDNELLELTGQLLSSNPDIYTLWNIRREVLQVFSKTITDCKEMCKIYDAELTLTEYCLKVNPKSYCAWHQREWVLTTRSDPDWKKELHLCNVYLQLDERNFHTWDYRRFIVSQHKTPLEDEFKYTTEKLLHNFSNYSAWHYRSKMLVHLYPDSEEGRPIADAQHKTELEMVESAAFTDPDDTSAWFYQRWLLGAVKKVIQIVSCTVEAAQTTVAFNTSVSRVHVLSATYLYFNSVKIEGSWKSVTGNEYAFVWIYEHHEHVVQNLDVKVEYDVDMHNKQVLNCMEQDPICYVGKSIVSFRNHYSAPVIEELKKQLQSCHQLLELEPESKWTLLTTTVLMHCCDPEGNRQCLLDNLAKLKQIDKLRAGYYDDVASKWIIEEYLGKYARDTRNLPALHSLYEYKITSLHHVQYFSSCTRVDFSNQKLTSQILPSLIMLQNCKVLNLENNQISNLRKFPNLTQLEELRLKGNNLEEDQLQEFTENVGAKVKLL